MIRPKSTTLAITALRRIAIAALVLSSWSTAAATYYRWVDAEGVTHYTSTPPKGVAAEKVTSATRLGTSNKTPPAAKSEPTASASTQQEVASLKDPERCTQAKSHLAKLQSGRRLRTATDDGGFRYMTEDDIREQTAITQQAIKESC